MLYKSFLLSFALLLTTGCGYKIGARTMMHPQIKTIAVAPVKNNTLEPLASSILRTQVTMEVQRDGGLVLKSLSNADCVLYSEITSIKSKTVRTDSFDNGLNYRPSEYSITVEVEFSVIVPGTGTPIISKRKIQGTATYQLLSDINSARTTAMKYACAHAAQKMIQTITEGW